MHQRLKIFFYTHALTGGGAERVWALLASGFARRGHDVAFAVDFEASDNAAYLDPSVRLIVLGGNHLSTARKLTALLAREKPDISLSAIGVSNIKHTIATLFCRRWGSAVQSYHGYYESEPQLLSRLGYLLTPLTTRLFARSVSVSDGLHDYLLGHWRASKKRTVRLYNPVLGGTFAPPADAKALRDRVPLVLAVGRLVGYKNFAGLVRAFARVEPKHARLVILGEGPEHMAIDAEIRRLGLESRVTLAGYVAQPWEYYSRASCLALSSDSESFGLVIVEALANGLPVVSTDSHGPREILDHGRFGALVPHRDEAAMAAALTRALADPGDPGPRVERAQSFSVEIGLNAYQAMFDDMLGAREKARGATQRSLSDAPQSANGAASETAPG